MSAQKVLDRVLIEAVSIHGANNAPTEAEAVKLDALGVPLVPHVSKAGRKLVAQVIANWTILPAELARLLILDDLEVAQPLLMRADAVNEALVDELAARNAAAHLDLLMQNSNGGPALRGAIMAALSALTPQAPVELTKSAPPPRPVPAPAVMPTAKPPRNESQVLEDGLRRIMLRNALPPRDVATDETRRSLPSHTLVARLINAALGEDDAALAADLARNLGVPARQIDRAAKRVDYRALAIHLKAAGLGMTDAYAILSIRYRAILKSRETMALFFLRYEAIDEKTMSMTLAFGEDAPVETTKSTNRLFKSA